MEDDTPLPRHRELFIVVLTVKEAFNISDQCLFHILVHDYIVPARILNGGPQFFVLGPALLVEDQHLIVHIAIPLYSSSDKLISGLATSVSKLLLTPMQDVAVPDL